jgi:hypothetical protein
MPKKLLATTIIITSILALVVGMLGVKVVEANPFTFYTQIEPIPETIPPSVIISSPQNNSVYPDSVNISFNVSKPQLTNASLTNIVSVYYSLDQNESVEVYSSYVHGQGTQGTPAFNTTFELSSLSTGNHKLTVTAIGVVLKPLVPKPQGIKDIGVFYISSNSTISFEIGTQPTVQEKPSNYLINPTFLIVIAILIVIVALASMSLVYFKKHKTNIGSVQLKIDDNK